MIRIRSVLLSLFVALTVAGCRIEVYDGLTQRDANEMTALLINAGIDAQRASEKKDGSFSVMVPEADFARAVELISRSGLPKPRFASIVDVLSDERLIASPNEERARLNYAVAQELSRTVSEIDGIVSARVHLATPGDDPLARRDGKSSASVAIHHVRDFNTSGFVPRIKMLVANAVNGLEYDNVSIALFPTSEAAVGWPDRGPDIDTGEFSDPLSAESGSRLVTPAAFRDGGLNPAVAAILAGGLIVLLLAGHTILTGSRRRALSSDEDPEEQRSLRRSKK